MHCLCSCLPLQQLALRCLQLRLPQLHLLQRIRRRRGAGLQVVEAVAVVPLRVAQRARSGRSGAADVAARGGGGTRSLVCVVKFPRARRSFLMCLWKLACDILTLCVVSMYDITLRCVVQPAMRAATSCAATILRTDCTSALSRSSVVRLLLRARGAASACCAPM